ncbi:Metacaspase-1 [Seminavis robusta]|uniref:Metacaspase-1 n=1 Tax=Seminavis robusta TaxID=568900 RepID=A0A9N8E1S5_9STRA|nr:Metacaspase-1 [Seminavis robusta]|eukprot:Sro562_g166980.1 Metacaspase-1 (562) ;mRNA; f:15161-16846
MSAAVTPGVTVTEKINEDGSKTVTTVTIHEDGSKSTKRKTIRPKKPRGGTSSTRSPAPAASKPSGGGSMEDALEDALSGHQDDETFENAVKRCIPSEFLLFASQDDATQAQEAHYAAKLFDLPNPKGQAGSVATSALVQYLYQNYKSVVSDGGDKPLSCLAVLQEVHGSMKKAAGQFDLQPQISYSRPLGPPRLGSKKYEPFYLVPPGFEGKRRALLIGICFVDDEPSKVLTSPHNDVHNVQQFLVNKCGFAKDDMMILTDGEGATAAPTKKNIWASFQKLIDESKPGDVVFLQYSGHGGRMLQPGSGDLYDSYILPADYKTEGQILDDDILKDLIKALPAGVHTTFLADCCNSGTVGDLPYVLKPTTTRDQEIERFFDTDTRAEILEAEAKGKQEREEYERAKLERKKQRELRKIEQEKAKASAKAKEEQDAEALAQQLVGMNTGGGMPMMQMSPQAMGAPQTHTYNITDESEVAVLSKKHGVALSLSPDQKACLQQGGTVTLSFMTQQPQQMQMMPQQQQTGMIMMTPEQAEAFKKANGGNLMMTPEQAAAFMNQQQAS